MACLLTNNSELLLNERDSKGEFKWWGRSAVLPEMSNSNNRAKWTCQKHQGLCQYVSCQRQRVRETVKCFVISYFHWCVLPAILILPLSFSLYSQHICHPSVCLYSPHHPSLSIPVSSCFIRSVNLFSPIYSLSTSLSFNLCKSHSGLLLPLFFFFFFFLSASLCLSIIRY